MVSYQALEEQFSTTFLTTNIPKNMKKINVILMLLLTSVFSHGENSYKKNGLSFFYPDGWKVTEDSVKKQFLRCVSIENTNNAVSIIFMPKTIAPSLRDFIKNTETAGKLRRKGNLIPMKMPLGRWHIEGYLGKYEILGVPVMLYYTNFKSKHKSALIAYTITSSDNFNKDFDGLKKIVNSLRFR